MKEVVLMEYARPVLKRAMEQASERYWAGEPDAKFNTADAGPMRPVEVAAFEAGMNERNIRRLLEGGSEYCDLGTIDRVFLAFDLFIERELPEEAFVSESDAVNAVMEQTRIMKVIARCHGIAVEKNKRWGERTRRQLALAGAIR